jgi:hypothetical protein
MKVLLKSLPTIALLLPLGLCTVACVDEYDEDWEGDQLRPAQQACPPCFVGDNQVTLGISTRYDTSSLTNVAVRISNSGGSELRDYDNLSVPYDPNTTVVTDNELCTVGSTGQPPTMAIVEFEFGNPSGPPTTVSEEIAITSTCP